MDHIPYYVAVDHVQGEALEVLQQAYEQGKQHVIFTHGWSTSRPRKTTARSQVRKVMRSREATPYIIRRDCVQHDSVFVAAIRQKLSGKAGKKPK
jgi:hypothetical protein